MTSRGKNRSARLKKLGLNRSLSGRARRRLRRRLSAGLLLVLALVVAGGLAAVIYTDLVQTLVLLAGAIALTFIGLEKVGGFSALRSTAPKYSWLARLTRTGSPAPSAASFSASEMRGPQKS